MTFWQEYWISHKLLNTFGNGIWVNLCKCAAAETATTNIYHNFPRRICIVQFNVHISFWHLVVYYLLWCLLTFHNFIYAIHKAYDAGSKESHINRRFSYSCLTYISVFCLSVLFHACPHYKNMKCHIFLYSFRCSPTPFRICTPSPTSSWRARDIWQQLSLWTGTWI